LLNCFFSESQPLGQQPLILLRIGHVPCVSDELPELTTRHVVDILR